MLDRFFCHRASASYAAKLTRTVQCLRDAELWSLPVQRQTARVFRSISQCVDQTARRTPTPVNWTARDLMACK